MDSYNSTGSVESSSGDENDDEYTSRPSAVAAPTATIFPFLMNSSSGFLPFLQNHDHNPLLPVFDAMPNSIDQIARPGSRDHHHQSQLFQLGAAVSGDELGVMLPPPALQVLGNLGYRTSQNKTSDVLSGGLPNLAVPTASDSSKLLDERPRKRNNKGALLARRNPRKRARVSRRVPTTVLTTDTSNFRAMVQEFTGIPCASFAAETSPFQRARLDLFGTNFASRATALGSSQLHSPSYLLRPFAQRLFQTAPPTTTLFAPATTSNNSNNTISTSTEFFFPLQCNNDSGPTMMTSSLSSLLDFGQILTKYSSGHNRERAEQEQHQRRGGNPELSGVNKDTTEEFGLTRQGGQDHDRDDHGFVVSSSSSQNVAIGDRSDGMPVESWICSSD